jgi:hypothetical protein
VAQCGHGYGDIQLRSGQRQFHVGGGDAHTIGAAQQRFEIGEHIGGHTSRSGRFDSAAGLTYSLRSR